YVFNQERSNWQNKGSNAVNSVGSNKASHSERQLYNDNKGRSSLFLIVQDAFPCEHCHAFFIQESASKSIAFKITANNGNYSADHGLGLNGSTPRIIYYHGGQAKMVSMSSRGAEAEPPLGFPAHPDFTDY
ncbi:MAG: hypothetical protein KC457_20410, partial [Myxococcales bacterium]|nr:hypothetical protein [Myxococcales bacterium]